MEPVLGNCKGWCFQTHLSSIAALGFSAFLFLMKQDYHTFFDCTILVHVTNLVLFTMFPRLGRSISK